MTFVLKLLIESLNTSAVFTVPVSKQVESARSLTKMLPAVVFTPPRGLRKDECYILSPLTEPEYKNFIPACERSQ